MSVGSVGTEKKVTRTFTAAGVLYVGKAAPGTATSAAQWQISRWTEQGDGSFFEEMADGNAAFDNIWDNVLSLTYS
ncbi:MAG: hypothetical protein R3268_00115 [Acidiferrobacterales bacterium]|nr:hypothetical protein [Acidiferrobacterales bacterium]